jgi:hypothetical protein
VRVAYLSILALSGAAGCVDGFRGSNVQLDLSPGTPGQAAAGQAPRPGQLPADIHYRLYAVKEEEQDDGAVIDRLFELQRFEIHTIIDLNSPCFIDIAASVPFPGLHVTQYQAKTEEITGITDLANPPPGATEAQKIQAATAVKRMANITALGGDAGIKVLTSVSTTAYPAPDADCNGSGLPPPSCIDEASNERRLRLCGEIWGSDRELFEGTDRVLTAPLNGTTHGFVVGQNPINLGPVGGSQFFVEQSLSDVDEYAIYYQTDGVEDEPGTLLLSGRPHSTTRGVQHVNMTSPSSPNITADMAVFVDLGEDDVQF